MVSATKSHAHPLDPLTQSEIKQAVEAVRKYIASGKAEGNPTNALFNTVALQEPAKYDILRWSKLFTPKEIAAAAPNHKAKPIVRQALFDIVCNGTRKAFEAVVDLPSNLQGEADVPEAKVSKWTLLDEDLHPSLQTEELLWAEDICRKDAKVKEACDAVGIDQSTLYVDGWCIAVDERFPGRRLQQAFCFTRLRPGDNLYAHPCDFIPVLDSHTGEVLTIDYPHNNPEPGAPHPPSGSKSYTDAKPRERFPPPSAPANYLPEQIKIDDPNFKVRDTLKPLHVIQPEGVSYELHGRVMKWQNWSFHIGFTYREGLVLSNITYDDGVNGTRPMFYRLSVAEMVVPYAKTIYPHHRKHAFDTGEYGIGALSNSLALGCDCLGSITYLDADFVTRNGGIQTIKSAICIHEEDAGILHKHTDYRDNKAHVARNRKLVVSHIATVANYDYGFYFNFDLAGSIELEVRATGIVNCYALTPNESLDTARETVVAPQIAAQHHQHLFSYRVDPMLDGLTNRVVQVDVHADKAGVGSKTNFYGNGFHTVKTPYPSSKQSESDWNHLSCRSWVIENPNKKNPSTGGNVGFKIFSKDMPPLLAKPGSMVWNRAPWARHNMFVTQFRDDEIFPSDVHINQNPGGPDFGLQEWVDRDDPIDNHDVVCWPHFGVTHICRTEDWPIMPLEILRVHLKPTNFFALTPAIDVPPSTQKFNQSTLVPPSSTTQAGPTQSNGHSNGTVSGENGACCGH